MKVAAILLMSTILVQAKPVEKREASAAPFDPFAMMVQKYISENDFNALCNITKQLQTILTESKQEEDQKIIEISLEKLKEATHHLENFHCQVPVTEIPDATLENEESVEDTESYQPIVNALFTVFSLLGIALLGAAIVLPW